MKKTILHYIRRILGIHNLDEKAKYNISLNNEIIWSQVFNSTIHDSSWLKIKSFSPGRWAMGYAALYITYRILNDIKPKNVLEFGLGESTKLTYQYASHLNKESSLTVIEQDENWLNYFSSALFDVKQYTKLLPLFIKDIKGNPVNQYDGLLPAIDSKKYDFIIIDGPWGSEHNSRYQINDIISNNLLDDSFVILMDDYERVGEKETMEDVMQLLNEKGIKFKQRVYSGVKETIILCSENYQFLTSL